ncbi:MAG: L-histidine N(alpha)-methyltransferase [Phycisphaeraceae bacterium]
MHKTEQSADHQQKPTDCNRWASAAIADDCAAALARTPPELPCKYLYDAHGSALFDRICDLPEYYPTRTELAIMGDHAREMAAALGPDVALVEIGSGASRKTPLLLAAMQRPACYVPIDISPTALTDAAEALARRFPDLPIHPLCADYTAGPLELPAAALHAPRRAVYFPGSTIGNFHPPDAERFIARLAQLVGPGGRLLVGVDQRKDPDILEHAYNDSQGVTAAFNRNILTRLNRDASGDFDIDRFRHRAIWNDAESRIEMHLVATGDTTAQLAGQRFDFSAGEFIRTECSYKHTADSFAAIARGCTIERTWMDERRYFAVHALRVE